MTASPTLLLDSDVFIAAKNAYYAFDICPGYWKALILGHRSGKLCSIDHVRNELLTGREEEDLVQWVLHDVPSTFFTSTGSAEVVRAYGEIMLWVQRNPQYYDRAKAKFATEADGWLVAYAMVAGGTVVTNEQPRPDARGRVLLPDVCTQFKVPFKDTFVMLRELAVRLDLE